MLSVDPKAIDHLMVSHDCVRKYQNPLSYVTKINY
jgi:hypothetical protein